MNPQYRSDDAELLDPHALERLRELDPNGSNRLLERVLGAFRGSLERMLPKLRAGRHDADEVRLVVHTLKSSSASVGALRLSHSCAELEAALRQGRSLADLDSQIDVVLREAQRVLEALPPADGPAR